MTMPVPAFTGFVRTDGKLRLDDRESFREHVATLAGQPVELSIRRKRSQRSTKANSYYWGVIVKLLAEHCGYDAQDMHEALAMKFLRIEDCPITGVPRRKRTPHTDSQEFADYVDACIRLAAELGVVIPEPHAVAV